uniref:phosphoethanolamine transferase domain-containing protein n=1 Tax=Escherichia coli TaxID=562 RepID=UPI00301BB001
LWLIPVFLFPNRIRIIAAVIGVILWAASLAALSYYVIYGQEFSQSVLYVMFETNANEASEYLSQYFSLKIVLIALAYTAMAILLWTRLRPVHIPSPWRYLVSFALLYGLILHPMTVNTFIKHKLFEKTLDGLASRMEPAAPWQFISGYYQYRQQLTSLNSLLNENNALPPLANFKDSSGDAPRTLVLVIGEPTQRGRMSLYGYPRETTPELDAL